MESSDGASFAGSFNTKEVRDHYDRFAWAYRRYWGDHIHHGLFLNGQEDPLKAQEMMLRHCATRAGVQPGMRVADVGCGHGGTARFLAREYSCDVLGITISNTQLKLARKMCRHLNGAAKFELADAESYVFPAATFDVIWNMESSEHFFDKTAYLRKVAAALKPGGKLMLAAWSGSMKHQLIRDIARAFLCPNLWTHAEYIRQIELAGLHVVSSEQLASEVLPTWNLVAEHTRNSRWLLYILPNQFREFANSIELMREGYRNGELTYSIVVAVKDYY
jgi:tocopherol O-methyltransferase